MRRQLEEEETQEDSSLEEEETEDSADDDGMTEEQRLGTMEVDRIDLEVNSEMWMRSRYFISQLIRFLSHSVSLLFD